jgi:hypothetical protein
MTSPRDHRGRFAAGNPGGPGRPKGRRTAPPPLAGDTLRLQILRDLAAGPDVVSLAQLELALSRAAVGKEPAEVERLIAEHIDAALLVARAARRVLIQELERQALGNRPAA